MQIMNSTLTSFKQSPFIRKLCLPMLTYRYTSCYLASKGWHLSAVTRGAIDRHGPVPWYTYPAQMILERVVQPHHRVFEYGCGNSSLWWAERTAEVVSVEHDEKWADATSAKAPPNLKVVHRPAGAWVSEENERLLDPFFDLELSASQPSTQLGPDAAATREFSAYVLELAKYPRGHFDIIVVDGMSRVLATWLATQYLKPDGFIVFDNSDRRVYNDGYALLADAGFKRIDFYGSGPINRYEWCTSLFAKEFGWLSANSLIPEDQLCDLDPAFWQE
jgi:hypothetical protein